MEEEWNGEREVLGCGEKWEEEERGKGREREKEGGERTAGNVDILFSQTSRVHA